MNNEMIKKVLSRYIAGNGMHPKMFFGKLTKKDESSVFVVKDAFSTDRGLESIDVVDKDALKSVEKYLNSYVCGVIEKDNVGQRLYIDTKQEAPVQIIPWEYINESNTQDGNRHLSMLDYFSRSCGSTGSNQTIRCSAVPLLGTRENPGCIIIYDTIKEGEVFLKGFLSVGGDDGLIQYSNHNIRIWGRRNDLQDTDSSDADLLNADFIDVVNFNQSGLIRWDGKWFLMLVPRFDVFDNVYMRRGEHSVLDYSTDSGKCGWLPLTFVNDNGDSKGPEDVNIATDQVRLGNGIAMDGSPVGEAAADVVGDQNLKSGQNEEEESQGDSSTTQKINNTAIGSQAPKSGQDEEKEFLLKLIRVAKECGYEYDTRDLVRFHTSVKIGGFTVLGGAPGCGKSSLVSLYARALLGKKTLETGDGYLTIDVSPSWMEPEDILGHWGLKGEYVCSQTGLVEFLRRAASEDGFPTVPIVCLEEMNLARVEHYFADFMQQLCRSEDERVLRGVPKDDSQTEPLKALLPLSPSIRFVGTNNFDQTTQRFSPRFYDRSNYIELEDVRESEPFSKDVPSFRADFGSQVDRKTYESWFNKTPSHAILEKQVVDKYKNLTPALLKMNLPVSRRVEVAILEYVANRPFLSECGDNPGDKVACQMRALDEVIAQKILSRYTGNSYSVDTQSEQQLEDVLKDLKLSSNLFKRRCGRERPSRS